MQSIMKSMAMVRSSSFRRRTSVCSLSTMYQPRFPTKSSYNFDSMSFASPEADFVTPSIHEIREAERQAKRNRLEKKLKQEQIPPTILSFASPYADTIAAYSRLHDNEEVQTNTAALLTQESTISFTSPESDFTAPLEHEIVWSSDVASMAGATLSYASPESDFCAGGDNHLPTTTTTVMDVVVPVPSLGLSHLSFSSPECDFVAAPSPESMSLSGDASALSHIHVYAPLFSCTNVRRPSHSQRFSTAAMVLAWVTGNTTTIATTTSNIAGGSLDDTVNEAEAAALASLPRTLSSALRPSTQVTPPLPPPSRPSTYLWHCFRQIKFLSTPSLLFSSSQYLLPLNTLFLSTFTSSCPLSSSCPLPLLSYRHRPE